MLESNQRLLAYETKLLTTASIRKVVVLRLPIAEHTPRPRAPLEPNTGLEPVTPSLQMRNSATELIRQFHPTLYYTKIAFKIFLLAKKLCVTDCYAVTTLQKPPVTAVSLTHQRFQRLRYKITHFSYSLFIYTLKSLILFYCNSVTERK